MKVRGVIVGEVLDFDANAEGAELTLGFYDGEIDTMPADVTGSIVPKTLFGEKYVVAGDPRGEHRRATALRAGDTIERTEVSIEVEEVLSDLYPLLRTVQPAELNMTLNALATALEGRGEVLGENLETLDSYLKRLNPQIPQLIDDLRLTAQVSDTYADVMPEIAEILRNTITTTGTLEDRDAKVRALYQDVAAFSDTSRRFLDANGDNLIRLGELGRQQLRVFAKYAPEYPCLLKGIVERRAAAGRGLPRLHAPHRARDAAEPAARLHAGRHAPLRRHARLLPASTCRPRRGRRPTRCATSPTSTTASTSRPARAPAGSRRPTTRRTARSARVRRTPRAAWPRPACSRRCSRRPSA